MTWHLNLLFSEGRSLGENNGQDTKPWLAGIYLGHSCTLHLHHLYEHTKTASYGVRGRMRKKEPSLEQYQHLPVARLLMSRN